jgi:hypothetical protein
LHLQKQRAVLPQADASRIFHRYCRCSFLPSHTTRVRYFGESRLAVHPRAARVRVSLTGVTWKEESQVKDFIIRYAEGALPKVAAETNVALANLLQLQTTESAPKTFSMAALPTLPAPFASPANPSSLPAAAQVSRAPPPAPPASDNGSVKVRSSKRSKLVEAAEPVVQVQVVDGEEDARAAGEHASCPGCGFRKGHRSVPPCPMVLWVEKHAHLVQRKRFGGKPETPRQSEIRAFSTRKKDDD